MAADTRRLPVSSLLASVPPLSLLSTPLLHAILGRVAALEAAWLLSPPVAQLQSWTRAGDELAVGLALIMGAAGAWRARAQFRVLLALAATADMVQSSVSLLFSLSDLQQPTSSNPTHDHQPFVDDDGLELQDEAQDDTRHRARILKETRQALIFWSLYALFTAAEDLLVFPPRAASPPSSTAQRVAQLQGAARALVRAAVKGARRVAGRPAPVVTPARRPRPVHFPEPTPLSGAAVYRSTTRSSSSLQPSKIPLPLRLFPTSPWRYHLTRMVFLWLLARASGWLWTYLLAPLRDARLLAARRKGLFLRESGAAATRRQIQVVDYPGLLARKAAAVIGGREGKALNAAEAARAVAALRAQQQTQQGPMPSSSSSVSTGTHRGAAAGAALTSFPERGSPARTIGSSSKRHLPSHSQSQGRQLFQATTPDVPYRFSDALFPVHVRTSSKSGSSSSEHPLPLPPSAQGVQGWLESVPVGLQPAAAVAMAGPASSSASVSVGAVSQEPPQVIKRRVIRPPSVDDDDDEDDEEEDAEGVSYDEEDDDDDEQGYDVGPRRESQLSSDLGSELESESNAAWREGHADDVDP